MIKKIRSIFADALWFVIVMPFVFLIPFDDVNNASGKDAK